MSHEDPSSVFATAQRAMANRDYSVFFACLGPSALLKIASNSAAFFLGSDSLVAQLKAVCVEHDVPSEWVDEARQRLVVMYESANRVVAGVDPQETRALSEAHRDIVKDHETRFKKALKAIRPLAEITAVLEAKMRANIDGGSVSSTMFVGETLKDIHVDQNKAWGTRLRRGGSEEDIVFIKKRDAWYIELFKKRPRKIR